MRTQYPLLALFTAALVAAGPVPHHTRLRRTEVAPVAPPPAAPAAPVAEAGIDPGKEAADAAAAAHLEGNI